MKNVLLLLAEGFEVYEAASVIDVIGWNLTEGDGSTKLFTCGLRKEVQSAFGQKFVVDYLVNEINCQEFDALAIPGGFEQYGFYQDAYDDRFLDLIRSFDEQQILIVSVCVGALPLGKSGVIKGRNATTYCNPVRQDALRSFGVNVVNTPIVTDGHFITSWNPSTAVDVAFMLLKLLTSSENARNVRQLMGFPNLNHP